MIEDEFTHLPVSRQRRYQLRRQRDGRCTECGAQVVAGARCLKHLVKSRERNRKKRGLKRRYLNTLGYRLAAAAKTTPPADYRAIRPFLEALRKIGLRRRRTPT